MREIPRLLAISVFFTYVELVRIFRNTGISLQREAVETKLKAGTKIERISVALFVRRV